MNADHAQAIPSGLTTLPSGIDLEAMADAAQRAWQVAAAAGRDSRDLAPGHRAAALDSLCRALRLNPLTNPLIYVTLNGKEVLYVTRQATDQIAARLGLRRETIEGPEVRDFAGTKLLYCKVRVTFPGPDGRSETATATLPPADLVNGVMKVECVPLDSEILTRRGFKRHDEVRVGEEVLAFDAANNRSEWVPLENVTTYPSAPVSTFSTAAGGFSFRCTPNHSWAVETNTRAGRQLIEAHHVKTHHHLRIAAPAEGGDHPLSPELAAVLGWVMCDGTIRRVGNNLRLVIYQSKAGRVPEIRDLLVRSELAFQEGVGEATVRTFPGGSTYDCLPQHSFRLTTAASKALFDEAGIEGPADLPRLVTQLSVPARLAMLKAMMAADGDARGNFGKKRKPGVMEAWQILCTLEGVALGKLGMSSVGEVPVQRMLSYDYVAGNNLALTPDGEEAVWCPTTKHGTWVMRQGGRITITGNTKAKRRATLSIAGLGMMGEDDVEGAGGELPSGEVGRAASEPTAAQARLALDLADCTYNRDAVDIWLKHRADLTADGDEVREAAWGALVKHVMRLMEVKKSPAEKFIREAIAAHDEAARLQRDAAPPPVESSADPTPAEVAAPKEGPAVEPPTLADFRAQLDRCPGIDAIANLWRAARNELSAADVGSAWSACLDRLAALMGLTSPKGMGAKLKKRIAELDGPAPQPPPNGTDGAPRSSAGPASAEGAPVAPTPTAGAEAREQRTVLDADEVEQRLVSSAAAWAEWLTRCGGTFAMCGSYHKRREAFRAAGVEGERYAATLAAIEAHEHRGPDAARQALDGYRTRRVMPQGVGAVIQMRPHAQRVALRPTG